MCLCICFLKNWQPGLIRVTASAEVECRRTASEHLLILILPDGESEFSPSPIKYWWIGLVIQGISHTESVVDNVAKPFSIYNAISNYWKGVSFLITSGKYKAINPTN